MYRIAKLNNKIFVNDKILAQIWILSF